MRILAICPAAFFSAEENTECEIVQLYKVEDPVTAAAHGYHRLKYHSLRRTLVLLTDSLGVVRMWRVFACLMFQLRAIRIILILPLLSTLQDHLYKTGCAVAQWLLRQFLTCYDLPPKKLSSSSQSLSPKESSSSQTLYFGERCTKPNLTSHYRFPSYSLNKDVVGLRKQYKTLTVLFCDRID